MGLSIEGPSKVDINCDDVEDGTCKVTYCPTEPGNYIINIKFADQHVPGSPFTVKIFGEGRMKESITRRRQAPSIATVGSTCDLNLKIPGNWFQMVSAQERLTRTFTRSSHTYTRTERTEISKTRAGETKREVRVEESTQVGGDPFRDVFGGFLSREKLSGFGGQAPLQDGEWSPNSDRDRKYRDRKQRKKQEVQRQETLAALPDQDSFYDMVDVLEEQGLESISQRHRGRRGTDLDLVEQLNLYEVPILTLTLTPQLRGSPLQFYVDAINSGHVTAFGPGLSHGALDQPAIFTIVTKDAGEGGLSLAVEGPSKAEINCKDNKDGTCTVSYLPTAPGDYNIIVKFDDKHIPGSPFTARIPGDDSMMTSQLNVGTATDVSLKITETDLSSLAATIRAPSGHEEPCLLKKLPNRHIGISFTPKEVGEHVVSVKKNGKHVTNSPFRIMVGQSQIGDASKVKVYGQGLAEGHTLQVSQFMVDTRNAA
ncbi:unnamed protein product [Menidia menidia]|uniref:(Atlantic silverside) hypothetical protein n=1 Tax=Menidia menidia TaxID=238744 RepID=A0A8S4B6Z7_9TELE|nr:unnamed protein product [Menidia menidia]